MECITIVNNQTRCFAYHDMNRRYISGDMELETVPGKQKPLSEYYSK